MTKVNIISGFLGAGKTTFIKRLISDVFIGEKIVLIENEFGEIGVDGDILGQAGIEMTEMNSGCICCSLVGDFTKALSETVKTYSPDRIIIEPSGVGKLSDVIEAVNSTGDDAICVDSCITVVDCLKCKIYSKNFGEFYENQIKHSDCILLTRVDKADEEKIEKALEIVRGINADANVVTTGLDKLDAEEIINALTVASITNELMEDINRRHHHHDEECSCGCHDHEHHHHEHHHDEECTCGCHDHHHEHHHHEHHHHEHHHHHGHHADEAFTSWGFETAKAYTREQVAKILEALEDDEYGVVLRAKGMLPAEDGWVHFDYVPGEANIRPGDACFTGKVCVIGAQLDTAKLSALFGR